MVSVGNTFTFLFNLLLMPVNATQVRPWAFSLGAIVCRAADHARLLIRNCKENLIAWCLAIGQWSEGHYVSTRSVCTAISAEQFHAPAGIEDDGTSKAAFSILQRSCEL